LIRARLAAILFRFGSIKTRICRYSSPSKTEITSSTATMIRPGMIKGSGLLMVMDLKFHDGYIPHEPAMFHRESI